SPFARSPSRCCIPPVTGRVTDEADTAGRVTGGMQHLEGERAEGDAVPFLQKNIGFSFDEGCSASKKGCHTYICIHVDISWMDGKWDGVDLAYGVDSSDVVNMSMCIDNILRNELQFLYG